MKRRYWINRAGRQIVGISLVTMIPEQSMALMFDLVECNWFQYHFYLICRINLKAGWRNYFRWFKKNRK